MLPLVWPTIPPLVDLPGHMGRYAVQLDPAPFARWYAFDWQLIGNLGVDLLIEPMARLFGVELGTKLIVMIIPALAVAGLLWIAREVHGYVPPTAYFALPLMWGHPLIFGFVNFSLAMALALLAFALWQRMARKRHAQWRPFVFLPLACVVWTAHVFGWGLLGLLCFCNEAMRQRDLGKTWPSAVIAAGLACLPMAVPLIPMIVWRSGATDMTGDWFGWGTKFLWVLTVLRDRWQTFDLASLFIVVGVIGLGLRHASLSFSRNLAASALVLLAAFVLLPRIVFGSAYADMRLAPYMLAIAVIAIRVRPAASPRLLGTIALAGLAFFGARMAGHTVSLGMASARYDRALAALDHVATGARVAAFTPHSCTFQWSTDRMEHLPALVIVRKRGFSNDQWVVSGANLMTVTKADAPGLTIDPSQLVVPTPCRGGSPWMTVDQALSKIPRSAFDYVWLIDPPRYDVRLTAGMTPVWRNGTDVLYRIDQ